MSETLGPKKLRDWPRKIKAGSVTVKVYRVRHATNRNGWAYEVAWHASDGRKKQKFADSEAALAEAQLIASRLQAGRIEASAMSRGERDEYVEAKRLVGAYPLLAALREWEKAHTLCGSDLLLAAQAWHDANGNSRKEISVKDLVAEFLKDKRRSRVDTKAGHDRTLPRVVSAFADRLVHTLSATELTDWLHKEFAQPVETGERLVHPSTFNSHRRRMVTMWRWARAKGYLPRNIQTEMEQVESMKEPPLKIGILSVPQFAGILRLIRDQHPAYLAVTVLAGFAGLRRAELHAQTWESIDLRRSLLRVTKAKKNTPQDRLVHLSPAAVEWLVLCQQQKGLVSPPWGVDYVRTFARNAQITCPPNGFRHSFVSYRVAATGDVRDTALEAGNSPDKIFHHYRELVSKEDGKSWFNLSPQLVRTIGSAGNLQDFPDPKTA